MAPNRVNIRKPDRVQKGLANSPSTYNHPHKKVEAQPHETAIPHATVALKQIKEKSGWGPNCPICKNIEEDWDGELQGQQQQNAQCPKQNIPCTQLQGTQQPLQKNFQCPRPKISSSHRTSSAPGHNPLTYQINMQNKSIKEESGKRKWRG